MEYKLAQELKDAGYPQIPQNDFYHERDKNGKEIDDSVTKPTLSELIEACIELIPDKFLDIQSREYTTEQWVATSSWILTSGKTPEEAVAKLWLALNKK